MRAHALPAVLAALALTLVAASPASAAGGGDPKVRIRGPVTSENAFASIDFEYRCATGHSATAAASIQQGGIRHESIPGDRPVLICDGDRHTAYIGTYLVGYDETDGQVYDFLVVGERAIATVVVTDTTSGAVDIDDDRVRILPR